jgi:hypothetical protein
VGRSELAVRFIGKAITLHDQDPGRHDARTLHPSKAAIPRHDLAAAHSNFCIVLRALGDLTGALKAIQRSLRIAETENAKLLFVGCLRNLTFIPEGIDLRDDVARAISESWGRPTDLARFASNLVKESGAIGTCIRQIAATWPTVPAQHELFLGLNGTASSVIPKLENRSRRPSPEGARHGSVSDIRYERVLVTESRRCYFPA